MGFMLSGYNVRIFSRGNGHLFIAVLFYDPVNIDAIGKTVRLFCRLRTVFVAIRDAHEKCLPVHESFKYRVYLYWLVVRSFIVEEVVGSQVYTRSSNYNGFGVCSSVLRL